MTLITGLALLQSSHFSLSAIVSRESGNSVAALSGLAKWPASPPNICCPEIVCKGNALIEAYQRPSGPCSTAEGSEVHLFYALADIQANSVEARVRVGRHSRSMAVHQSFL